MAANKIPTEPNMISEGKTLFYMNNKNLKRSGVGIEWTGDTISEYLKCKNDPVYFIKTYIKIVNVDHGLVPFTLWPFQEDMIKVAIDNRFVICKMPRQVGKCDKYDTLIKIREKVLDFESGSYKYNIRNIQMGKLYDEINSMQDLQSRDERSDITYLSKASNQSCAIQRTISKRQDSMRRYFKSSISKMVWRQESCISTQWDTLAFFREIYRNQRREYSQESCANQIQEWQYCNDTRILSQANGWGYKSCENTLERSSNNIQSREVYPNIWGNRRSKALDRAPTKVAKNINRQTISRNSRNKQEKESKDWKNFYGRKSIDEFNSKLWNTYKNTTEIRTPIDKSFLLRHVSRQEDHRIQWGLLACKSTKIFARSYNEFSKKQENSSTRCLEERQNKIRLCDASGLSDFNHLGNGLQKESGSSYQGVHKLSDTVERKFIDSIPLTDIDIWTDTGWQPASVIHKTVEYVEWILKTENHELTCADTHIVFLENGSEVYVKDLVPGDKIKTESGSEEVISIIETDRSSHMYDITVDSDDHRFYTNGILSHNTTTVAALLLWYILFNENFKIAILANKEKQSREILSRIQLAFEHIPHWLQQGVVEWNKGNIELENGSKILSASTSSTAIRGDSFNMIYLDEFAFVPSNMQDEFFASVYPTISSGKTSKILITSTPNGMNMFYKIWTDSEEGRNSYRRVDVHWSQVPGRDAKWRDETINNTSERQFSQEFESIHNDSLIYINGRSIKIGDLYNELCKKNNSV